MKHILEIKNFSKRYQSSAIENISFSLEPGYVMGLIGPNGAGKTTIIKAIMNLIKKDDGVINVFGLDHIVHEQVIKDQIGFVYDENYFYEHLTPKQIESIISPFYSEWNHQLFKSYLERFEILQNQKIKQMSKGMKMKFSIAMALSHNAKLLILDEPTAGLDPIVRRTILDILREVIAGGDRSVLFSTHITGDLEQIADYITFVHQGKLIFSKEKEELYDQYAIVKGEKGILDRDIRKLFLSVDENPYGFEGLTAHIDQLRPLLDEQVIIERPTLEQIMVYTVRGKCCD
ncbi:sodium ABC transporter ATP-binding protein [Desulfuribacillus stibiiarsenatis]|uniref:Sodium ABC transporter ATP-binding protein n=1 Tax=Desulfuribacillus stibiiarsenatis TaxID=1390249 RepID=A0A1E5L8M9_9FIRM|nr:ABC transporter ATP-binding protein [Desulfuribacillus stibiiarsenatis]OEH86491.1 sodium ABC transporter ATP-binding protein [Desulfuribacillus stibiiarsenatis]